MFTFLSFYSLHRELPFVNTFTPDQAGDYVVGARVFDDKGESAEVTVNIKVRVITGQDEWLNTKALSVFPNPSESGVFRLSVPTDYHVYNALGNLLLSGNGDQVDLSGQLKGLYFLKTNQEVIQLMK